MPDQNLSGEFILNQNPSSSPSPNNTANNPAPVTTTIPTAVDSSSEVDEHGHVLSHPKFYSSLSVYPQGVIFQSQEADEEVVLLIRRDFITNVPWIASIILLAFVPPLLFILVPIFFPGINISTALINLSIAFYYVILFGFIILNFAIWYFNVGLVTNKRVIDMNVANILVKQTSEARLNAIADVTYTQVGSIRGIFNYGDVRILTETPEQNLEFDRAPNPNMIRKIVGDLLLDKGST